jgi:hypothetical protein
MVLALALGAARREEEVKLRMARATDMAMMMVEGGCEENLKSRRCH